MDNSDLIRLLRKEPLRSARIRIGSDFIFNHIKNEGDYWGKEDMGTLYSKNFEMAVHSYRTNLNHSWLFGPPGPVWHKINDDSVKLYCFDSDMGEVPVIEYNADRGVVDHDLYPREHEGYRELMKSASDLPLLFNEKNIIFVIGSEEKEIFQKIWEQFTNSSGYTEYRETENTYSVCPSPELERILTNHDFIERIFFSKTERFRDDVRTGKIIYSYGRESLVAHKDDAEVLDKWFRSGGKVFSKLANFSRHPHSYWWDGHNAVYPLAVHRLGGVIAWVAELGHSIFIFLPRPNLGPGEMLFEIVKILGWFREQFEKDRGFVRSRSAKVSLEESNGSYFPGKPAETKQSQKQSGQLRLNLKTYPPTLQGKPLMLNKGEVKVLRFLNMRQKERIEQEKIIKILFPELDLGLARSVWKNPKDGKHECYNKIYYLRAKMVGEFTRVLGSQKKARAVFGLSETKKQEKFSFYFDLQKGQ